MSELIVGIDLGTTNSALAAVIDGQIRVIPIHGQQTMPSCVGLDAAGQLIVGQAARNQLVAQPDQTLLSVKRQMGTDEKLTLGSRTFSPEEISSLIIRELKREAETVLGQPVKKAVITVPAFFNERQRKATQLAGELAGLDVVRIINEPTAAALAYGAGRSETEKMLVYDLGGGTFDVSVVTVEDSVVEVKASHGDTRLGGDDFDELLVDAAITEFNSRYPGDLRTDATALRRLKVALEAAKIRLSDEPFATVREEYLDGKNHLEWEISREFYEELIEPLLEKTVSCVGKSLADSGLTASDMDNVMLVGGASRTPLVHQLLTARLDQEPRWEINPDLIVAMGAAVQGSIIAGDRPGAILVDISAHTFRTTVATTHPVFGTQLISAPLIPRGTPLPATRAEVYFTMVDNQESVEINAAQGESVIPAENAEIGHFMVEGLSKVPSGSPIIIQFSLNLNGMLQVTGTEKITGLAKTVTMDTRDVAALDLAAARKNIASLLAESDPGDDNGDPEDEGAEEEEEDSHGLLNTVRNLRKRSEAILATAISEDDGGEIRRLLQSISDAVTGQDWEALASCADDLSDLLFYLED